MVCTVRCGVLFLCLTCIITVTCLDLSSHDVQLSSVDTKRSEISSKRTTNMVSEHGNKNSNFATLSTKNNNAQRSTVTTLLDDELEINGALQSTIPERAEWISLNTEPGSEDLTNIEQTIDFNTGSIDAESTETRTLSHEGSGDYDYPDTTADVVIGKTSSKQTIRSTTVSSKTPLDDLSEMEQEFMPGTCFRTTCNESEIEIGSGSKIVIPEFTNLVVGCHYLINTTHQNFSLHWYFINSTMLIFKNRIQDYNLFLSLDNAQKLDSGIYKCVRKSEQFCCSSEVTIVVYEMPNYKFHMVIVGAVALSLLAICILLSIAQAMRSRKYRNLEKANQKQEPLLTL